MVVAEPMPIIPLTLALAIVGALAPVMAYADGKPRHIPMYGPDGKTLVDSGEAVSAIVNHRRIRSVANPANGAVSVSGSDYVIVIQQTAPPQVPTTVTFACSDGLEFLVKDGVGNDRQYPITLKPAAGLIDGRPSVVMNGSIPPTPDSPGYLEVRRVTCDRAGNAWLTDNVRTPGASYSAIEIARMRVAITQMQWQPNVVWPDNSIISATVERVLMDAMLKGTAPETLEKAAADHNAGAAGK